MPRRGFPLKPMPGFLSMPDCILPLSPGQSVQFIPGCGFLWCSVDV